MGLGHLLERGGVDLFDLRVAAILLAGVDLDRFGHAHAVAQPIGDELEEREIERCLRVHRHGGAERHRAFGLQILGQRGGIGDLITVRRALVL